MSITVKEALELKSLKNFKLLAGEKGLNNQLVKLGILDYETEEQVAKNFEEGEFVISALFVVKDDPNKLEALIKKMIAVGISGLAIKNVYFKDMPNSIIELADTEAFPLFIYGDVYYEDVMQDVMEALRLSNEREALAERIEKILYQNLKNRDIEKFSYEINRDFMHKNIAAFCIYKEKDDSDKGFWYNLENNYLGIKIIPFKEGYLFISTFDKTEKLEAEKVLETRLKNSGVDLDKYYIGIGTLHQQLGELNYSLKEAIYGARFGKMYNRKLTHFGRLGSNKLIMPMLDEPWVKQYYDDIIIPILNYDEKNDTKLLETAVLFVEKNGNIKATSEELFQHTNTIRYRIDKIYKILEKTNSPISFYEDLAMAIRIYNLLKGSL